MASMAVTHVRGVGISESGISGLLLPTKDFGGDVLA